MTREGAASRLNADEEQQVDRRRVSDHSRRKLAEAIRRGETDTALRTLFEVITGKTPEQYPTVRDVAGGSAIADGVTDKRVRFELTLDGPETVNTNAYDGHGWQVRELPPGEYAVSASLSAVYAYDMDTLEETEYVVEDATVELSNTTMTIDPTTTPIGEQVTAPDVTLSALTLGGEK